MKPDDPRVAAVNEFFVFHNAACSVVADATTEDTTMVLFCPVCQQQGLFALSEDDVRELLRIFSDDAVFAAHLRAARRRVIQ